MIVAHSPGHTAAYPPARDLLLFLPGTTPSHPCTLEEKSRGVGDLAAMFSRWANNFSRFPQVSGSLSKACAWLGARVPDQVKRMERVAFVALSVSSATYSLAEKEYIAIDVQKPSFLRHVSVCMSVHTEFDRAPPRVSATLPCAAGFLHSLSALRVEHHPGRSAML